MLTQCEFTGPHVPHESYHLPPQDAWLHNPFISGRIPTPTDERGLVDFRTLIATVDATVDPAYTWPSDKNDIHHLQWPKARYGFSFGTQVDGIQFRNLAVRQAVIPRTFHNWLHAVTLPSEVPSQEIMAYLIEAERVTKQLFRIASLSVRLERFGTLTEGILHDRLMQQYDRFWECLEEAASVPSEFQLIDISTMTPASPEDLRVLAPQLGRVAAMPSVAITARTIRQTNRAA
ncbi:MAG: hypothetical protein WAQ25_01850 [Candidatus Saccharimonas sp.]